MYPLFYSHFNKNLNFIDRFSTNTQISNSMKIRPMGAEAFHAERWTDGRTEKHEEAHSRFSRNFANAPKNHQLLHVSAMQKTNMLCIRFIELLYSLMMG